MTPYFLFFDFDNTVYVNKKISNATMTAMKVAQAAGHKLILCTGRSEGHSTILPEMYDIPWDGMIFGGADIYYQGVAYEKHTVAIEDLQKWLDYAKKKGYDLVLEGQKKLTTFRLGFADPLSGKAIFGYHEQDFNEDQMKQDVLPDLSEIVKENPVTKITVMKGNLDPSDFPDTDMPYIIHPTYMEAFTPGCGKGVAIEHFCKYVGITLDQCACFGDSMNDYSMFEVCPSSIAMQWAPKALSEVASYTSKTEEGIVEGLEWLLKGT